MVRDTVIFIILYYDIFKYPLKETDIVALLVHKYKPNLIQQTIHDLHQNGLILEHEGFYSNSSQIKELVDQRKASNLRAEKLLKKVGFYAGLLSTIPFVKAVALSGSLSKGSANTNADIDFIVITKHNRLWICKSLVQLLKRVLRVLGKEHYLCANYFIAESKTELDEKNIFIAIELATLVPLYGADHFQKLLDDNNWSRQFVSNSSADERRNLWKARPFYVLKLLKYLASMLLFFPGNWFDNLLMRYTKKRWHQAHFSKFNTQADFDRSIKIRKNEIKYHLNSFQQNVIHRFDKQVAEFATKNDLVFTSESLELFKFITEKK